VSGADINMVDIDGVTPLMTILHRRYVEWVEEMLRLDADAHCVDNVGNTALHWFANSFGEYDKPSLSLHVLSSLVSLSQSKDEIIVKRLIASGCDYTLLNDGNKTACDILIRN
jgi:ankyrin repeat protein